MDTAKFSDKEPIVDQIREGCQKVNWLIPHQHTNDDKVQDGACLMRLYYPSFISNHRSFFISDSVVIVHW